MRRFILAALFCFGFLLVGNAHAQSVTPLVDQTTPFRDPAVIGDVIYNTGDELATRLVFNGTFRVTNITFKYTSRVPINYTVRFYKQSRPILPQLSLTGPLVKAVTFTNLPAGTHIVTRELTPEQEFDWAPTLDYQGTAGGFYSVQLTRTDGSNSGLDAGFQLAAPGPGAWLNLTRGGGEDVVSTGLIPNRPEFEEIGVPAVGFFISISAIEIPAPPPARLSDLQLSTNTVSGGTSLTGTVTLSDIVPEDTTVAVFPNNGFVQAPATVTVPAGEQSISFPIATGPTDLNRSFSIQANYAGKTVQQFLVVTPANATLTSFTLSVASVRGGTGLRGVVTLSGPFTIARTVTVSNSSNGAVVQTPLTVTVPAGAQFVSFPITTSSVSANRTVIIRATFAGKTLEQSLTVTRRR